MYVRLKLLFRMPSWRLLCQLNIRTLARLDSKRARREIGLDGSGLRRVRKRAKIEKIQTKNAGGRYYDNSINQNRQFGSNLNELNN